jgi:predicted lipoprotein with Yx(FWY)xxD motif
MKPLFTLCLIMTVVFVQAQNNTVVKLKNSPELGSYLTDQNDKTLYFFSNDANGKNNCSGGCATAWPIFSGDVPTQAKLGEGLSASDFGSITLDNGKKQITYKGWPLYYFSPKGVPEAPNATTGEGAGDVWYVAKPDYTVMIMNTQLLGKDGKKYKSDYTEGEAKTAYFTDAKGRALYGFIKDKKNKNNFSKQGEDSKAWIVYEADRIVVPSKVDKSLFGTIDVFGKKQLTYNGWPLYYFGDDEGVAGSNKGVSVPKPGIWPIAARDMSAAPE